MNWTTNASTGWDTSDPPDDGSGGGGGGVKPFWYWMPNGVTKRIMFLDGEPFCLYEHNLWAITKDSKDRAICLAKNGIDDRGCPPCDKEMYPSYVGYFSVIDMGDVTYLEDDGGVKLEGWTSSKGVTYQFTRKLYGAKRGSKEKPGILKKLARLAQRKGGGSLAGTVWDVTRDGEKSESIGNDFEFIEKVEPSDVYSYLKELGAQEKFLKTEPYDYAEVFGTPRSFESLYRLCYGGDPPGNESKGDGARSEGASYGEDKPDAAPPYEDDDIPF